MNSLSTKNQQLVELFSLLRMSLRKSREHFLLNLCPEFPWLLGKNKA